jgi:predicted kinase
VPALYILCGASSEARAALAREIVKARGIAHVSLEHVKADEGYFMSDDEVPQADWAGIHDVVHASLLMPLRLGRDVVYDAPNLSREDRDELRELAATRGFAAKIVYVGAGMDAPSDDEDAAVYREGEDAARWVKAHL